MRVYQTIHDGTQFKTYKSFAESLVSGISLLIMPGSGWLQITEPTNSGMGGLERHSNTLYNAMPCSNLTLPQVLFLFLQCHLLCISN